MPWRQGGPRLLVFDWHIRHLGQVFVQPGDCRAKRRQAVSLDGLRRKGGEGFWGRRAGGRADRSSTRGRRCHTRPWSASLGTGSAARPPRPPRRWRPRRRPRRRRAPAGRRWPSMARYVYVSTASCSAGGSSLGRWAGGSGTVTANVVVRVWIPRRGRWSAGSRWGTVRTVAASAAQAQAGSESLLEFL